MRECVKIHLETLTPGEITSSDLLCELLRQSTNELLIQAVVLEQYRPFHLKYTPDSLCGVKFRHMWDLRFPVWAYGLYCTVLYCTVLYCTRTGTGTVLPYGTGTVTRVYGTGTVPEA